MEKIKEFLKNNSGSGYGDGVGSGYGYGVGSGYGDGVGSGYGYGYGSGYGYGDGDGYGYGYGDGDGIKEYNKNKIYIIDGIQTIIISVRNNIAKGYILNKDLTLTKCYIVKGHNKFAHGETLRKAVEDLQNKIFKDMDTEETIDLFLKEFADANKKYPAKDFYIWHNRLTGSCEMGRQQFAKEKGIDIEKDTFTVKEFINLTKNAYGGDIINQLKERIS